MSKLENSAGSGVANRCLVAGVLACGLGCGEPSDARATSAWATGGQTAGEAEEATDGGVSGGAEATGGTTTDGGQDTTGVSGGTGSTTGMTAASTSSQADASSTSSGGPVDLGCDTPIFEQAGVVKVIEHGDSYWSVMPLEPGQSFHCMRVVFDIQTVDSQQEILDTYEGCPIFLAIAGVRGSGPEGNPVGSMLFKPWKVGCTPGPDRVELDTFVGGQVEQGPWPLGGAYHVVLEANVDAELSTVSLFQDGAQVGPTVSMSLAGVTLEMNRNPEVSFGMTQPATGAYFPDYGATYSDLVVTADIAE